MESIKVDDTELAYFAGFLDGEGTFLIHRAHDRYYKSRISCGNTYLMVLERLKRIFGGSIIKRPIQPNRKPFFVWYVDGHRASDVAKQLLPFLREKKLQAEIIIDYEASRYRRGKSRIKDEEWEYRAVLSTKLRELHQ